jgi:siderophore synthetase component
VYNPNKEENPVLANRDLRKEMDLMEEVRGVLKDEYQKSMLKASILMLKLLKDIRTNQVLALKADGVALIEPKDTTERE